MPTHHISQGLSLQGSGLALQVRSVSASTTLLTNDHIVLVDASAGAVTLTLPSTKALGAGFTYEVRKIDSSANAVTIDPAGSETVDGATTRLVSSRWNGVRLVVGPSVDQWYTASFAATPQARVTHSANQSIANTTTTALAFDSEAFDTDAIHDTATNNTRLTCKTAGRYLIYADVSWPSTGGGTIRQVGFRVNGSDQIGFQTGPVGGGTYEVQVSASTEYTLAANDYVECVVFQDSGGALNVLTHANFSPIFGMVRVG